eukprot:s702_g12.t1
MSAMAGASSSADGPAKSFSGDSEDGREYKRWKTWVTNKLLTLDAKVPAKARGAYVYTLLTGRALECVEHLDPTEYQVEDGELKLFKLLDERFPQKDASDEMSEALTEVFNLRAAEGETLKVWISRATELFDRCHRKCGVSFPEEAKGWMLLHRSGLNEEQKAVVLARSGGVLSRLAIGKAMRSCYPEYVVSKRRTAGAGLVDVDPSDPEDFEKDPMVQEVEAFLAEHDSLPVPDEADEIYEEHEVAEALAVSWKDKRRELSKMQRSRRFGAATDLKKSYRVEIEELKRKTRCHRCNKVGHWSRECKEAPKGKGRGGGNAKGSDSGAACVQPFEEQFVAAVSVQAADLEGKDTLSILRHWRAQRSESSERQPTENAASESPEIFLVSSPGHGVIDSGCGRTIIGRDTLEEFKQLWEARGIPIPQPIHEINHFKFGNGQRETSDTVMKLPVVIAGKSGIIKAALVQGHAPLLISRGALQTLKAVVDFGRNQMRLFDDQSVVSLKTNEAGQYVIDVMSDESSLNTVSQPFDEIMMNQSESQHVDLPPSQATVEEPSSAPSEPEPSDETIEDPKIEQNPGQSTPLQQWCRHDSFLNKALTTGKQGPPWQSVRRRRILNSSTGDILFDEQISHSRPKQCYHQDIPKEVFHVTTEFFFEPQEKVITSEALPVNSVRQFTSQVQKNAECPRSLVDGKPFLVAEVFSPPRFAPLVEGMNAVCKSYDLKTGYDFTKPETRDAVARELRDVPPDLLVLCPPCTDEGGWFHLNSCTMDPKEYIRRVRQSRLFIRFCCQLFKQQVALGGQAVLEHPQGSQLWTYAEVRALIDEFELLTCHMCRYGLRIPKEDKLIRKATRLLVSHKSMKCLAKTCPGKDHPNHVCHQPVAGYHPRVGPVSTFAGKYTPQFVEAVMETVPRYVSLKRQMLAPCPEWTCHQVQEVLAAKPDLSEAKTDEELLKVIDKVHRNLGHPPNHDLIRILKHAQASERAIQLAHKHDCQFCKSQIRPHVPLPAKTSRPGVFNQCVGVDVKYLTGWLPNQRIKALNMVDQASCYQLMVPFYERETSDVLKRLFSEHWVKLFGPPREVIMDQAQTNLGENFQAFLESQGCHVHPIAGEAHWQIGRTESHGGWFGRVLDRTMAEYTPKTRIEWEACVTHAHVKNTMIQSYGYTPHQHVFGKNPDVPTHLMSEPLHVVPATASLSDEAVARTQEIRAAARRAVIQTQDDAALRRAFSARPRLNQQFQAGELVAYWRNQKLQQGQVVQGGRWYGTAVVVGNVGKNYIIAHRKQIFRAAPEQLRPATTEEKALVTTPQTELLGIKDMIEGGTFRSHQFIDLVPGHYPTMAEGNQVAEPNVSSDNSATERDEVQAPPKAEVAESPPLAEGNTELSPTIEEPIENKSSTINEESTEGPTEAVPASSSSSSYGPMRRRVNGKGGPMSLYRPAEMRDQDFTDMMREVVHRLIEQATSAADQSMHPKRPLEEPDMTEAPSGHRPRTDTHEVMSVQDINHLCSLCDDKRVPIEVMVASYLEKKMSKELPPRKNPVELQKLVDESKRAEWDTIVDKSAVKIHYGRKAAALREKYPERFIGSRFVIIRKAMEEDKPIIEQDSSTFRVKSRWCLQGHLDPDLDKKVAAGLLQSPTLSQLGRMLVMQLIASNGWLLQLGDIKGAFLEAGPLPESFRPLFAKQPYGGIPGLPEDAVIEITGNLYGQNDAPSAWHRTFNEEALKCGWEVSRFDACLYFLREPHSNKLCGVMGVHVDDTAVGGEGEHFKHAVESLKKRFPYRKWRVGEGEFCGSYYVQSSADRTITMSQRLFAEKLRPATIPKQAKPDDLLSPGQIRMLRAINGSLNWIASQSRPDLAVQTSLSQQAFPQPRIKHLRDANNAIRRAKMHKELTIKFQAIPVDDLCICCHSDAAFANVGSHTQAGYVLGFSERKLNNGDIALWTPVTWKSYKLPRAVSSTLGGESQAMASATGTVEWLSLMLAEALDGHFEIRECRSMLAKRPPVIATDCKSLYDHLISPSSPTAVEDRRTSIDIVIIRESIKLTGAQIRWLPTDRMIADGLTKDKADPIDLLRSCVRAGSYQVSPEEFVLARQADERARRAQKRLIDAPKSQASIEAAKEEDMSQLRVLLAKAKSAAGPPSDLLGAHPAFPVYDSETGLMLNPHTGETKNVWEDSEFPETDSDFMDALHFGSGGMSDAAKRREADVNPIPESKSKRVNTATGVSALESSVPYAAVPENVPYASGRLSEVMPGSTLPPFPKGIESVSMWGRTVIDFGMFKSQRITYEDLVMSDEKQKTDYVKWCRARSGTANGHLKDFCDFMRHYFQGEDLTSGMLIPGTSHTRILKP